MDIAKEMQEKRITGLGICRFEGERLYAENYGFLEHNGNQKVEENSIFHACSISKFISAIAVFNLAAEGVLDLNRDVNDYMADWKLKTARGIKKQPVTLNMLLAHYAGIDDVAGSFEPYTPDEPAVLNPDLLAGKTRFHHKPVQVTAEPGSRFSYSDAGYCVIEHVVESVTGHGITHFVRQYIFEPLQLQSTFFWQQGKSGTYPLPRCAAGYDASGLPVQGGRACYPNPPGAGLWSTPSELAVIARDFMQCLHGRGKSLPQEQAVSMLSPYGPDSWAGHGVFLHDNPKAFLSQGWGVGMQCKFIADIEHNRGIVVMMNCDPGTDQEESIIGDILRQYLRQSAG